MPTKTKSIAAKSKPAVSNERQLFNEHHAKPSSDSTISIPSIVTARFQDIKKLPPTIEPVGIAVGPPAWFNGRSDKRLAPSRAMLSMSRDEYDKRFFDILYKLDPEKILAELTENHTKQIALLCWCKPNQFCHRRYVAEWLESNFEIVVPEYGFAREVTETFLEWH